MPILVVFFLIRQIALPGQGGKRLLFLFGYHFPPYEMSDLVNQKMLEAPRTLVYRKPLFEISLFKVNGISVGVTCEPVFHGITRTPIGNLEAMKRGDYPEPFRNDFSERVSHQGSVLLGHIEIFRVFRLPAELVDSELDVVALQHMIFRHGVGISQAGAVGSQSLVVSIDVWLIVGRRPVRPGFTFPQDRDCEPILRRSLSGSMV